jgi:hypothetical protein
MTRHHDNENEIPEVLPTTGPNWNYRRPRPSPVWWR